MFDGSTPPRACNRASFVGAGPSSTIFSSSSAVERMISFARFTSVTPGSCTRIWSFAVPCGATIGSATPSSFTRRSMVCSACFTDSSRSVRSMFGLIVNA